MNAKAALCKALIDGLVINHQNIKQLTSYTNPGREIPRQVEKPFGVEITRVPTEGKNRFEETIHYTDYRLTKSDHNIPGIIKMQEYIDKQKDIKRLPCRPKEVKLIVNVQEKLF